MTIGDGAPEVIALRVDRRSRRGALVARTAAPGHYESYAAGPYQLPTSDFEGRARWDPNMWDRYLRHHRSPTVFRYQAGVASVVPSAERTAFDRCARDFLATAGIGQALLDTWAGPDRIAPQAGMLLDLLSLRLQREMTPPAPRPTPAGQFGLQETWRDVDARTYGLTYTLSADLIRNPTSPAARLCQLIGAPAQGQPVADRCHLSAVIDRRDGWPITADIHRIVRTSAGEFSATISFYRLRLRQAFVAPPNPCASFTRP
jgi:hypothetical protein